MGKAWYRSFLQDTLIHRVSNCDTVPLHVTDIEILSSYNSNNTSQIKPLPFPVLFNNERATAYQLTNQNIRQKIINSRRPLIAQLATGEGVYFHDTKTNKTEEIKAGQYLYIEPKTSFYFEAGKTAEVLLILLEIK